MGHSGILALERFLAKHAGGAFFSIQGGGYPERACVRAKSLWCEQARTFATATKEVQIVHVYNGGIHDASTHSVVYNTESYGINTCGICSVCGAVRAQRSFDEFESSCVPAADVDRNERSGARAAVARRADERRGEEQNASSVGL